MAVSPARAAAFDILLRVQREGSYASELLHAKTYEQLSTSDHGLATELVMGVLRWQSLLDDQISRASSQPLKKLDVEVLIALRIAVYQLGWLTRIPQRAALHESVELVKRAKKRSAAPFVNAVLRTLSQKAPSASVSAEASTLTAEELSRASAHPLWLVESWAEQYGVQAAQRICAYDQSIPGTTLRLRTAEAEAELASEGISLAPGKFLAKARRVESGDVTKTRCFRNGLVVIQDEASQLVAALIGEGHERILDCCAAPGGKTLAMADQNPGAAITAVELHPHRARLMQKLFGEDSRRIQILTADARDLPLSQRFERILADVPCSGTGTLARNPEIKWRLKPEDLKELHGRQQAILRAALEHLAPGGRVIYSTCSLEREENEEVIEATLEQDRSARLLDCGAEVERLRSKGILLSGDSAPLTRGAYLRTIPGVHACDGFFAAILQRA